MSVVAHSGSEIRFSRHSSARAAAVKGVSKAANSEEVCDTIALQQREIRPRPSLPDGVIFAADNAPRHESGADAPADNDAERPPLMAAVSLPRVVYLAPKSGPGGGRTTVTIFGNSFTNVTEVLFGDVPASGFEVVSSNRIDAVAPPHEPGEVDVFVSTVAGTSAAAKANQFTYVTVPAVTELQPSQGPTRGGTLIVVHGVNFVPGQTKVHFGNRLGKDVKVLSDRLLVVKSPAGEAGTAPLVGGTAAGDSAEVPFVYDKPAGANQDNADRQPGE
jgi:hypothetical protein